MAISTTDPTTATITSENTFTDWVAINPPGRLTIGIDSDGSSLASTVTVQVSLENPEDSPAPTIFDAETIVVETVRVTDDGLTGWIRVGVKTGDFDDSVNIDIRKVT